MYQLTDRQSQVLNFLQLYHNENGYYPSYHEIAELCGVTPQRIYFVMQDLIKKGYVVRKGYKAYVLDLSEKPPYRNRKLKTKSENDN